MAGPGKNISHGRRLAARKLRALRSQLGARRALAARARWSRESRPVPVRLAELEAKLADVQEQLGSLAGQLVTAQARLEATEVSVSELAASTSRNERGVARAALLDSIAATTAWVAALPCSDTLISVILPTRNRASLLSDAIVSVEAQTHAVWELIVVDDDSDDDTSAVLDGISDPRVRVVHRRAVPSPAAARNAGLAAARGEVIAYLDDDNIMQPHWLRAIAWEFDRHPDVDVAYGALLLEDRESGDPVVMLEPWSRARLAIRTLVDQNVIAHRARLPEARFDEELDASEDWDIMLRLTADRNPACVAVLAALYRSDAPDRMSDRPQAPLARTMVRDRALRRRRLRLLGVGEMANLTADDLAAAEGIGAQVAWCANGGRPAPEAPDDRVFPGFREAVEAFQPDLVYLHREQFAALPLREVEWLGLPFAVRAASSDGSPELARRLRAHPLCAGVWCAAAAGGSPERFVDELICGLQRVHLGLVGALPRPAAARPRGLGPVAGRTPSLVAETPQ